MNGGTCTNGVGTYSCECTPHFTGETCEDEVEGKIHINTVSDKVFFSFKYYRRAPMGVRGLTVSKIDHTTVKSTAFQLELNCIC